MKQHLNEEIFVLGSIPGFFHRGAVTVTTMRCGVYLGV